MPISDGFSRTAVATVAIMVVYLGVRWLIEDVRIAWQMCRSRTSRRVRQEQERESAHARVEVGDIAWEAPAGGKEQERESAHARVEVELAVQVNVNVAQASADAPEHERTWKRCPRGHWYSSSARERCPRDQEPLAAASAEQQTRIVQISRHELVCLCIPHPLVREAFVRFVMALEEQEGRSFLMGDAIDLYRLQGIAALKNEQPDEEGGDDDAGRAVCV